MPFSIRSLLLRKTSVRLNVWFSLGSKFLAAAVSLVCVPIYIRILGVGGYGVIGVWLTLETLTSLVDLGLGPALARELAANNGRANETDELRDLTRTVEVVYWALSILAGATITVTAPLIASRWLQSNELSRGELQTYLQLIAVLIFFRWPGAFYTGGLNGLERQVLLSWVTFIFALLRSVGAVGVLVFLSPTVLAFFIWQIVINITNTAVLAALMWLCLPMGRAARFRTRLLIRIWKFAGGVAAVTLVSVLLTDLDKLVVSGLVSLEAFGYYTLASRMAGTLYMISSSVFATFFPALVRLATEGNQSRLVELYHEGAQILSVLIFPAAITGAFFAKPLIFAWTGSEYIADHTAPIATLLIIGTAAHCVLIIPYAIQLAYRWTSLAFWTNLAYVPVTTVLLLVLARRFGGIGAAAVWLLITTSYFATQIPLMHRKLLRFEARRWYVNDVGIPLLTCSLVAGLLVMIVDQPTSRFAAGFRVALAGILVGAVGLLATPLLRRHYRGLLVYLAGITR
jgi:O-antigen/teichoic acid export membrane protein